MQQRKVRTGAATGAAKLEQLEQRQLLSTTLDGDVLRILTGASADMIVLTQSGGSLKVQENRDAYQFDSSLIRKISIATGAGNDRVQALGVVIPMEVDLGAGNDTLMADGGHDTIHSGAGADLISATGGDNEIYTDTGTDRVIALGGKDTIWSGSRSDLINTGTLNTSSVSGKSKTINVGKAAVYHPMYTDATYQPGAFQANVTGFDPNQIRQAYGFGDFDPNAGAGQTIFIVDAFTGLHVQDDFTAFCNQFDLPVPTADNFQIVNASGKAPAVDSGWDMEIMLDLEWARAIAPAAKLVLVQADSSIEQDMYVAIKKAADMAQKVGGIVSMSIGRDFVYDPTVPGYSVLTTPSMDLIETIFRSHPKVTFLAASGDNGNLDVASYPAMSPSVTAVGGTVLTLDQDGNQTAEEAAWIAGGSGYALQAWFERPGYQNGIPYALPDPTWTPPVAPIASNLNVRALPDVSYNATNFAIYTTTPQSGDTGWFAVGGTSAGTPQWAAIVALANQKRVAAGQTTIGNRLNGIVYDIYNGYAALDGPSRDYSDCFNDIIFGQAGPWFATTGFDMATGVGTPKAEHLIDTMGSYTGFYINKNFTFESHLYMPYSVARTGLMSVAAGQTHTGVGSMIGTDTLNLIFLTAPVPMYGPNFTSVIVPDQYFDATSAFSVHLYRTGRGQTSGRIYGTGEATIFNADQRIALIAPATPMTFMLKFDGRWTTGKDGQIHYYINFGAVNPLTLQPLESGPAQLTYDPLLPWLGAYLKGSITG